MFFKEPYQTTRYKIYNAWDKNYTGWINGRFDIEEEKISELENKVISPNETHRENTIWTMNWAQLRILMCV